MPPLKCILPTLLVLVLASDAAPAPAADRPNVLFIAADDMNCDLSAFGNSQVKTPNLERLAKLGVRFDRAYCQQPLCGPSRASLMTGLRPDTLDMHTLAHELRDKNPDVVTLGQLFRNNGYFLGEKGLWYKRKAFERSAKMPMIIAAPGLKVNASTTNPVELLDLYPTLADLCGLKAPGNLEGASLRPLLEDPAGADWTKPAVTQIWHNKKAWGYSIRTDRYRYTEWLEGEAGRELYDHSVDPGEVTNLASDDRNATTVEELSKQLRPFIRLKPHKRASK